MPEFLFTDKLPVRKLESVIWNSLPICLSAGFMVVTVSLSDKVSQKSLWVTALLQGQPGTTRRRVFSYLSLRGQKQWLLTSAIFSSYLVETLTLIFRYRHYVQFRGVCVQLGVLALLLATASAEGSHPIFLISLQFCFLFLPTAEDNSVACQSPMFYCIFGIQFPVFLCVTDLSLYLTLIQARQIIYFCCFELLSCHIYAISSLWVIACLLKNKAVLSVMISSATIIPLFYSEGYLQLLCFSLLDPRSNFLMFFVYSVLYLCFH